MRLRHLFTVALTLAAAAVAATASAGEN